MLVMLNVRINLYVYNVIKAERNIAYIYIYIYSYIIYSYIRVLSLFPYGVTAILWLVYLQLGYFGAKRHSKN